MANRSTPQTALPRLSSLLAPFLGSFLTSFLSGCSHVAYLYQAGMGQWAIYNHERPVEEVIADPHVPSVTRERLAWLPEIRAFVEQELGVRPTSNYTTYVELKRPYVVWSLTSAEPYGLKLKEWPFPIVGSFPYLGFFREETAREWEARERALGRDTHVRGVTAYSTLGYLRDPLLSTMLTAKKTDLVNLLFHETTHSRVYVKGEGAFNEQIAGFIGDYGERAWIVKKICAGRTAASAGVASPCAELENWNNERADRRLFGARLRAFADRLGKLYAGSASEPEESRRALKAAAFSDFRGELADAKRTAWKSRGWKKWISEKSAQELANNAGLLAHLTYEDNQELFEKLYRKAGGDAEGAKNTEGSLAGSLQILKRFSGKLDHLRSRAEERSLSPQILLDRYLASPDSDLPLTE